MQIRAMQNQTKAWQGGSNYTNDSFFISSVAIYEQYKIKHLNKHKLSC